MKSFFVVFRNIVFISLGIFLFWLVYKDIDITKLFIDLKNANYFWVILAIGIAMLGHLFRALRWKMLVVEIGYNIKTSRAFIAVLINYLANIAIPRAGEISRPLVISKTDKASLSKLMGTIIVERVFDMITLLTITFAAFLIEYRNIKDKLYHYLQYSQSKYSVYINLKNIIILFLLFIALITILILIKKSNRAFKQHPLYIRIRGILSGFWSGIKSIWTMKGKWIFVVYTLFIWITYFLLAYLLFFSIEATSHLGLREGFFVLVLSSLGFIMPSPGGIGTYHAAAVIALGFYQVGSDDAKLYAFIAHGSQTLMILVAGVISYLLFLLILKKQKA